MNMSISIKVYWIIVGVLSLILIQCKVPEIPILVLKPCKNLKGSLSLNRDYGNINKYYFNCDSLEGNIQQLTWKINGQIVKQLREDNSFDYVFEKDGSFTISVEVKDSCNQVLTLKKELLVKTDVYVQPITRFVNNDYTEADIQGMTFDSKGQLRGHMIWGGRSQFIGMSSYVSKSCMPISDGNNGDVGNITCYRYREATNQNYFVEVRYDNCITPRVGYYVFRRDLTLQTFLRLGGRTQFELGQDHIFIRGASNIVLVPYGNMQQIPELLFVQDTIKYEFNSWDFLFGKFNENEYLAVSKDLNLSKYVFVKFNEQTRSATKLFEMPSLTDAEDGRTGNAKVGVGTILDLCIDSDAAIWVLEAAISVNAVSGFPNTKYRIRKITKTGEISTVVTRDTPQIASLVNVLTVSFDKPKCLAFNPKDNAVYFSDGGRYKKIVVK